MAATEVKELWSGRDGSFGDDYSRRYTRVFRVRCDSEADGPIVVAFAAGVPRIWDAYTSHTTGEYDLLARCRKVDPRQIDEDPRVWEVHCTYETITAEQATTSGGSGGGVGGEGGGGDQPGNGGAADRPEFRPPEVSWDFETVSRPLRNAFDPNGALKNGKARWVPVVNSAGQPFDPLPEYDIGYPVLNVSRYEVDYDPLRAEKFAYALNKQAFMFAGKGEAQCLPITAKRVWIGLIPYWQVSYKIRFAPKSEDWVIEILDAGRKELQGNPGDPAKRPVDILDPLSLQAIGDDWPLNGAGKALTPAQIAAGNVKYVRFEAYRYENFAELNLDGIA